MGVNDSDIMTCIFHKYAAKITPDAKMLLDLRNELYNGSWDEMIKDLNYRMKGRPFVYKLVERIKADLRRIDKLQEYEKQHGINLMDYISVNSNSQVSV